MAIEVFSPEVAYVTKNNIKYPGTQAQATAAEVAAQSRLGDAFPPLTITVAGGTIKLAT